MSNEVLISKETREAFFAHLKEHFYPRLRKEGFSGSGSRLGRIRGEVIQVVEITREDGLRGADRCWVSLCTGLTFLPGWINWTIDRKKYKYPVMFSTSLIRPGDMDSAFLYADEGAIGPQQSAQRLIDTYYRYGAPMFEKFQTAQSIAESFTPQRVQAFYLAWQRFREREKQQEFKTREAQEAGMQEIRAQALTTEFCDGMTDCMAALTLARIERHLGNEARAREYAKVGLLAYEASPHKLDGEIEKCLREFF